MPEEIIFDENIKGKVQVESLSELDSQLAQFFYAFRLA